ncbi:type IV secretory system conjugative DNA transfer family protein [Crateriforma conspicua]|uniref:TraM recognition site of TraD and TraG n=1 Tax=Crateriforma conspicua TaxID=2527996 RepID=A0A5C6FGF1_9PLAN|nr:type IV secretory system conjugative DNA transfer family protein [Crateriforma conspicua]TWU59595.1 hypothetical protein V7x_55050 [Crateriforma conspicua]
MGRMDIWNNDVAPEFVAASIGAGKFATDLAIKMITYMGSGLYCSVKPELADFALGRNVSNDKSFKNEVRAAGLHPGVDPEGITKSRYRKPRFRAVVVDPYQQSVYGEKQDCPYTFIPDISPDPNIGIPRAMALAEAFVPDKKGINTDPFFTHTPRSLILAGLGHVRTKFPAELQHLPALADFLTGRVPSGGYSPEQFQLNLKMMMANPEWGGVIAATAAKIFKLGEKSFGAINAEVGNALSWVMEPAMRRHLSSPISYFSYEYLGDDMFPLSIFLIPGRVALSSTSGFMRAHVAMFTAVMKTKTKRPSLPVVAAFDESRQYSAGTGAAESALVLRDNRIKQIHYFQTIVSARECWGEHQLTEYLSAATARYYGIRTVEDAEFISRSFGNRTDGGQCFNLVDPQTVLRELAVSSDLQYVVPFGGTPPMRLHRRAFKTIRTGEGAVYRGLPLDGHYDDGLSRFN